MGPQEEYKIFNKIKCDKWTLWVKQAILVRFADAAEGGRRFWELEGSPGEIVMGFEKKFFNFKLEGFDHIIHDLM